MKINKNIFKIIILLSFLFNFLVSAEDSQNLTINYPNEYTLFQRFNDTTGEILIYGKFTGNVSNNKTIEARFGNGEWQNLSENTNLNSSGGIFSGRINATVGQGNLIIRFSSDTNVNASVSQVGIGDIFIAYGQSNSVGWGSNPQQYNTSNIYNATKFNIISSRWELGNDPVSSSGTGSSPYPLIANFIIKNQSIPVGFISAGVGGMAITSLIKGTSAYNSMMANISIATNGTMRVRGMLYFQGESDTRIDYPVKGNYADYAGNLTLLTNSFINDTEVAEKVMIGQIGSYYDSANFTNRYGEDNIRKAQSDSWEIEGNFTNSGPITYDIAHDGDPAHFKNDAEISAFADRWIAAIYYSFYEGTEGKPPKLINITMQGDISTNFTLNVYETSSPLKIKYWNGTLSSKMEGWHIVDNNSVYNDSIILSTTIINNSVVVETNKNLSKNVRIWFGSFNDATKKSVLADSSLYSLPIIPFYNQSVIVLPLNENFLSLINTGGGGGSYSKGIAPKNQTINLSMPLLSNNKTQVKAAILTEEKPGDKNLEITGAVTGETSKKSKLGGVIFISFLIIGLIIAYFIRSKFSKI